MMSSFKTFSDRNKGSGLTLTSKLLRDLEGRNVIRQTVVYAHLHDFVM